MGRRCIVHSFSPLFPMYCSPIDFLYLCDFLSLCFRNSWLNNAAVAAAAVAVVAAVMHQENDPPVVVEVEMDTVTTTTLKVVMAG